LEVSEGNPQPGSALGGTGSMPGEPSWKESEKQMVQGKLIVVSRELGDVTHETLQTSDGDSSGRCVKVEQKKTDVLMSPCPVFNDPLAWFSLIHAVARAQRSDLGNFGQMTECAEGRPLLLFGNFFEILSPRAQAKGRKEK